MKGLNAFRQKKSYPTQWALGEVGGRFEADGCSTVCAGFRATLCVHVPCVLRVALETLRAVAPTCYGVHVSLHKDVVQCVINRLLSCPCDVVLCDWGAARDAA